MFCLLSIAKHYLINISVLPERTQGLYIVPSLARASLSRAGKPSVDSRWSSPVMKVCWMADGKHPFFS